LAKEFNQRLGSAPQAFLDSCPDVSVLGAFNPRVLANGHYSRAILYQAFSQLIQSLFPRTLSFIITG
jgi:hypothetical protein